MTEKVLHQDDGWVVVDMGDQARPRIQIGYDADPCLQEIDETKARVLLPIVAKLACRGHDDPAFPEHAKLAAVKGQSQAIGDFLEWLSGGRPDGPVFLCERRPGVEIDNIWAPITASADRLLAEYFGIDPAKLEQEKRMILAAQRKANRS